MLTNEERLIRLERSNRYLRIAVIGLGAIAGGIALLGAAAPMPTVIKATKFVLVDENGIERAELSSNEKAASLQILSKSGKRAVALASGSTSNAIFVSDQNGRTRQGMIVDADGTATFGISGDSSADPFLITDGPKGTAIVIHDPQGHDRLDLGYSAQGPGITIANDKEVVQTAIGERGMMSFNSDGKVIWTSFGENLKPEERQRVMDLINQQMAAPK